MYSFPIRSDLPKTLDTDRVPPHENVQLVTKTEQCSWYGDDPHTESTPQRADRLCSVLISAVRENTRVDDDAFRSSYFKAESSDGVLFMGLEPHPYGVDVVFPSGTLDTPDISNPLLCAGIGSATGLLVGIALIAVRRTSLAQLAEPRC